ncbi:MAG: hypothetical protein E6G97_04345 [Alphaproteobacteria bacterium]|nr:MAG: hypothetical protein E6G97_04345 [Alphaproteobacteria bacterium]
MATRIRAGASARPLAARRRAPLRKTKPRKSTAPSKPTRRKTGASKPPAPKPTPSARPNGASESRRVTPWGVITVRSGRPLGYTPELKAHIRYRFEQTPESEYSIAADLGVHHFSLKRLAKREGWVRGNPPPPRDITPVMRLAAAVDALVGTSGPAHSRESGNPASDTQASDPGALGPRFRGDERTDTPAPVFDTSVLDRFEAAVLKELAAVELMRAHLGTEPLRPLEAQITARTLSVLTETLAKVRRLRLGSAPQSGSTQNDDDYPADIDEFRREFARRIDAFVASRTDAGRTAAAGPAGRSDPV